MNSVRSRIRPGGQLSKYVCALAAVNACIMTMSCASTGSTSLPPPLPPQQPPPPPAPSITIDAPSRASRGTTPAPPQWATASGPRVDGYGPLPAEGTFSLTTATVEIDSTGVSAVTSNQSATAIIKNFAGSSTIRVVIPSVGVDTTTTVNYASAGWGGSNSQGQLFSHALSYTAYGFWTTNSGPPNPPVDKTAFVYGYETPVGTMPTTGSASYTGVGTVIGAVFFIDSEKLSSMAVLGDAELTANFTTGAISGALSNMKATNFDWILEPWNDVSIAANVAAGSNRFSGSTTALTAPNSSYALKDGAAGFIDGAFYGPNAENIGAVWSLSDGTKSAMGGIGATRQ